MDMTNVSDFVVNAILIITSVIGGASMVVSGLREIAKVTPTEKDDKFLSASAKFLNAVTVFFDKLALNPPKHKARETK